MSFRPWALLFVGIASYYFLFRPSPSADLKPESVSVQSLTFSERIFSLFNTLFNLLWTSVDVMGGAFLLSPLCTLYPGFPLPRLTLNTQQIFAANEATPPGGAVVPGARQTFSRTLARIFWSVVMTTLETALRTLVDMFNALILSVTSLGLACYLLPIRWMWCIWRLTEVSLVLGVLVIWLFGLTSIYETVIMKLVSQLIDFAAPQPEQDAEPQHHPGDNKQREIRRRQNNGNDQELESHVPTFK